MSVMRSNVLLEMPEGARNAKEAKREHCGRSQRRRLTFHAPAAMSFVRAVRHIEGTVDRDAKQADNAARQ